MRIKKITLVLLSAIFFSCGEEPAKVTIETPSIQCGMCQKNIEMGLKKIIKLLWEEFKNIPMTY